MKALGAARLRRLLGALCALCAIDGAIAIAAFAQPIRHRPSHSARACHRSAHRAGRHKGRAACRHTSTTNKSKHSKRGAANGEGLSAPWATVPAPVIPGGAPSSGSPPSAGQGGAEVPVETPTTPAVPAHVEVTAEDGGAFRFVLSRPAVPAGKVIIEFVNHGQDEHNLNAVEPSEGAFAGSLPNTAPNAHPSLTLNLRAGHYTLFCSLADHEAKGMKATLVVN
jgi:plastocyanin